MRRRRLFWWTAQDDPSVGVDEEFRHHMQERIDWWVERGLSHEEARARALDQFGDSARLKRDCVEHDRSARRREALSRLRIELGQAARKALRNPGFAFTVVGSLALGIGFATTGITVAHTALVQALPYPAPEQLFKFRGMFEGEPTRFGNLSPPDVEDYRREATLFEEIGGVSTTSANLTGPVDPVSVEIARVTAGYFGALGVRPALGRLPTEAEFSLPAALVWISDETWRRRFGADPDIVDQDLYLDDRPFVIVGVMAPDPIRFPGGSVDFWIPLPEGQGRGSRSLTVVGRLRGDASPAAAQAQLDGIAERLGVAYPDEYGGRSVRLERLRESLTADSRQGFILLLAGIAVLLLVVTANLTTLVIARAADRKEEMSIRMALGAGASLVRRALLVELIPLFAVGTTVALYLSWWALRSVRASGGEVVFRSQELGLGVLSVGSALVLALVMMALTCSGPVLRAGQVRRAKAGGRPGQRRMLVAVQVACTAAILVCAGVLGESFLRLVRVDPGFDRGDTITFRVRLPSSRYGSTDAAREFYRTLTDRLRATDGVMTVSAVSAVPFSGHQLCDSYRTPDAPDSEECAEFRSVDPAYFETLGISMVEGRNLAPTDRFDRPPVAVVNVTLAREAWGDASPIGRMIEHFGVEFEVVGVVSDIRHFGLDAPPVPELYASYEQRTLPWMTFVVHVGRPVEPMIERVHAALWSVDAQLPPLELSTLDEKIAGSIAGPRRRTLLAGGFAVISLGLSLFGLYGLMAFAVARRTLEFGVRLALGAAPESLHRRVFLEALTTTTWGLLPGLFVGLLGARALQSVLFDTAPTDPVVLVLVAILMWVTALAAVRAPARRVSRLDPVSVIRSE